MVPELGESCKKNKNKWVCTVHKQAKWSDGTPITATDFVESFKKILSKPAPRSDLLFNIKNAQVDLKKMGLKVLNEKKFEIEWENNEPGDDFILMSPLFVPLPNGEFKKGVFSGPFQVDQISALKVEMSRNPHYFRRPMSPLKVHWLLMDESLTVQAFEKKELDFLIGIGATTNIGEENIRYLSICKNKFNSFPNKITCRFDSKTSRFKEM